MAPENKQFLDDNRHHYETFKRAGIIKHFDSATRERMLEVIHQEFNKGYIATLWCQSCIADMLEYCYTQYDKYVQKETLADGIIAKATFPSNKKSKKK